MHDADTMVTDVIPTNGRHRPASSPFRRAVGRMSLGGAAVLLTIVVGVLAAAATGLTGSGSGGSAGVLADFPSVDVPADPTPARAAAVAARQTAAVATSPQATVDAAPTPVADPTESAAAAPITATPETIPTVRQGERCSDEGARGITAEGKPTVCVGKRGDGPTRWRRA